MPKKNTKEEQVVITSELEKLHPVKGDIFILNINSDDPDVLYSEDILESVDNLADTLEDLIGFKVPVLVFGTELDLNLLSRDDVEGLIEQLQSFLDEVDTEDEIDDEEHLTDQFN